MSSYAKWDRAAYIERVGGKAAAEQRRKVLMARQSGRRSGDHRRHRALHPGPGRAPRPGRQLRRPHGDRDHHGGCLKSH
jgi:hypothetical protein